MIEKLPVELQNIDEFIKRWNIGYEKYKTNYMIYRNKADNMIKFPISTVCLYKSIEEGCLKLDDPFVIYKREDIRVHSIMTLEHLILLNLEDVMDNK